MTFCGHALTDIALANPRFTPIVDRDFEHAADRVYGWRIKPICHKFSSPTAAVATSRNNDRRSQSSLPAVAN